MNSATYKLRKQSGGIGHYAQVTVRLEDLEGPNSVILSGTEFDWLKESYGPNAWEWPVCDPYREGALFGASYALSHRTNKITESNKSALIVRIDAHPAHTDRDDVAYAACFATWQALEDEGTAHPYFEGSPIIFLDAPNLTHSE